MENFNELGLSEKTLGAVARLGYEAPTPVQEQAIPLVLEGRDLIAAAKTGTGKMAAFSLPAMDRLGHAKGKQGPLMLVVTPTRELAQQIGEVCTAIAVSTHHRILTVVGGLSYEPQIKRLRHGVDVLIATPGRLIDLMEQQAVHLNDVGVLVLDEADRMLDMGFWPSMKKIVAATPAERQTLLFSATIDRSIQNSVGKLLRDPALVEIAHKGDTADTVDQYIVRVPQTLKPDLLRAVLNGTRLEARHRVRTHPQPRRLHLPPPQARRLRRRGHPLRPSARTSAARALDNFASGATDVIVATDVLARGIDVEEVDYVVNYDLPTQPEDYVHRIGRTGRAGARGYAISFVSPETEDALRDIETAHQAGDTRDGDRGLRRGRGRVGSGRPRHARQCTQGPRAGPGRTRAGPQGAQKGTGEGSRPRRERGGRNGHRKRPGAFGRGEEEAGGARGPLPNRQRPAQQSGRKPAATGGRKPGAPGGAKGKAGTTAKTGAPARGQAKASGGAKPQGTGARGSKQGTTHVNGGAPKRSGADLRPGRAHRAAVAKQRRPR